MLKKMHNKCLIEIFVTLRTGLFLLNTQILSKHISIMLLNMSFISSSQVCFSFIFTLCS